MTGVKSTAVLLLITMLGLSACGGEGDSEGTRRGLLDHLPRETKIVATVDLAAAREALGLPTDADPAERGGRAHQRLLFAAAEALPHLQRPFDLPILDALDHGEVREAATGGVRGADQVTAVRTAQPVAEVLEGLARRGYRRENGVLVIQGRSPVEVVYGAAGEAGGLLILGGSEEAVRRALKSEGEGRGPVRDVLEELEGASRLAVTGGPGCIEAIGGGDRLQPPSGAIVIVTERDAEVNAVRLGKPDGAGRRLRAVRFRRPKVERRRARVAFTYDPRAAFPSPLGLLATDSRAAELYECDDDSRAGP